MIHPYKKVAIIYGGSGYTSAVAIEKEIMRLHTEEFYPVKPCILAKHIMSGSSIIETVQRLISESSACIGILTFDDCDQSRVRQNVLIELGMALILIDKNKCFYISDRVPLPEDFPSDLRGLVNPNLFDKDHPEIVAREMSEEILKNLHLKSVKGILENEYYLYNYRKILSDIPAVVFEEKYDRQLEDILNCWESTMERLDFCAERLMYILERVNYLPNFTINERYFRFLDRVEELCVPAEMDFEMYPMEMLLPLCRFTCSVIRYIRVKYTPVFSGENESYHQRIIYQQLKNLEEEIGDFVAAMDGGSYNWYIRTMAHDYAATVSMKAVSYAQKLGLSWDAGAMDRVEDHFREALAIVKKYDICSRDLWNGYIYYNLARVHTILYGETGDASHLEANRSYIEAAVTSRREWLRQRELTGAFGSALSYEYFLACKHRAECQYRCAADPQQEMPQLLNSLREIKAEMQSYCQDTEFGRLYEIRDAIDELWEKWESQGDESGGRFS